MKIAFEVKESNIKGAGNGLFAAQFIPKGTVIWEFSEESCQTYVDEDFLALEKAGRIEELKHLVCHSYWYAPLGKYVLIKDEGAYMNHNDEPNCSPYLADSDERPMKPVCVAKRDIFVGEELYESYNQYDPLPALNAKLHRDYQIWDPRVME
jgi:SET domain-containing protein